MRDKANDRQGEKGKTSVVRLDDLAPRHDIVGGADQLVFGEGVVGERGARDRADRGRGPAPRNRA